MIPQNRHPSQPPQEGRTASPFNSKVRQLPNQLTFFSLKVWCQNRWLSLFIGLVNTKCLVGQTVSVLWTIGEIVSQRSRTGIHKGHEKTARCSFSKSHNHKNLNKKYEHGGKICILSSLNLSKTGAASATDISYKSSYISNLSWLFVNPSFLTLLTCIITTAYYAVLYKLSLSKTKRITVSLLL